MREYSQNPARSIASIKGFRHKPKLHKQLDPSTIRILYGLIHDVVTKQLICTYFYSLRTLVAVS